MGVEDDAVDAEVIADLQNRIKETQKDIQVTLIRDAAVHWVPLTTSNLIQRIVLVKSGTRYIRSFQIVMPIRSVLF